MLISIVKIHWHYQNHLLDHVFRRRIWLIFDEDIIVSLSQLSHIVINCVNFLKHKTCELWGRSRRKDQSIKTHGNSRNGMI